MAPSRSVTPVAARVTVDGMRMAGVILSLGWETRAGRRPRDIVDLQHGVMGEAEGRSAARGRPRREGVCKVTSSRTWYPPGI